MTSPSSHRMRTFFLLRTMVVVLIITCIPYLAIHSTLDNGTTRKKFPAVTNMLGLGVQEALSTNIKVMSKITMLQNYRICGKMDGIL